MLRRSAYLELGGYPRFFFHAYEEPDFALRCIANGMDVLFFSERTIRHHYSNAQRNEMRTHSFHARNELWSIFMRCPWRYLPAVAAFRLVRQFSYASHRGARWVLNEPRWWASALAGIPTCLRERNAVSTQGYREWMRLLRSSR